MLDLLVCQQEEGIELELEPVGGHPAASFVGGCAGQVVGCRVAPLLL